MGAQLNAIDSITIVEPADLPSGPISPRPFLNALLALFFGLMGAVGLVFLLEYLDDTVKGPAEIEKASLTALGTVTRWTRAYSRSPGIIVREHSRSSAAEAFRILRTGVQFAAMGRQISSILVTSPNPEEGKTTVVGNLAWAMAHAGKRVIAVDTDLRRPSLHKIFGVSNEVGITNMLLADSPNLKDYLIPTDVETLSILPSGTLPPNPAELLDSKRMSMVMEQLKAEADIVLLDSPPLLAVADSLILSAKADGVVLVLDSGQTRKGALQRVGETLTQAKATVLGCVLNKVTRRKMGGYGYYYYYYYHHYNPDDGRDDRGRWWFFPWRKAAKAESDERKASGS